MALSDKDILITPNIGSSTGDPKIVFKGADATTGPSTITVTAYPTNNGTLSFDGSAGQLFSITNNLTSGSIYSVNDVSGIPSIDVDANGTIQLGPYGGNIGIGTTNPTTKLDVVGNAYVSGNFGVGTTNPNTKLVVTQPTANTCARFESGGSQVNIRFSDSTTTNQVGVGAIGNDFIITMATGGERLRVTTGGDVGIGTTNPTQKLDVFGNIRLGSQLTLGATATPAYLGLGPSYSNGSARSNCKIRLYDDGAGDVYGFSIGAAGDVQYHSTTTHQFYNSNVATLLVNGTSASYKGNAIWHSGNDGAGSGLDADLLDGLNSATTNTASTIVARDSAGNVIVNDITAYRTSATNTGVIYLNQTGTRYVFYDGTQYQMPGADLFVSGSKVWTGANDGAGSGLDADLLDGLNSATTNTASTIVARDGSGNFSAGTITATGLLAAGATSGLADVHFGPNISDTSTLSFTNTSLVVASKGVDQTAARTNVMTLMRDGTSGVVFAGAARFDLSRWQADGVSPRTQLTIALANTSAADLTDTLSLRSDGVALLPGNMTAWSTTTPGLGVGGIHLGAASATGNAGPAITFGARDASSGANAQAGIYVNSDGTYGTRMYLATTNAYATGSLVAMSISETGVVNFVRTNPTSAGNQIWHAGNDGAGSGLDADLLDGLSSATANTASTIVSRDASGNFSAGTVNVTNLISSTSVSAAGASGFLSTTFATNARNPIWRFGNADTYGLSYFQGTSGVSPAGGGDTLGFHFGTATAAASLLQLNNGSGAVINGTLGVTGQLQSTQANSTTTNGGQIFLNGATGNRIDWNTNGVAAPAFTTRSAGTKLVLYPAVAAASVDYALGVNSSTLWYSVPTTSDFHRWYAGTTNIATLSGAGVLSIFTNGSTLYGPNSTWSASLRVGGNGNVDTTNASVVTTNGNLHLDSASGAFGMYLNYYKGTTGVAFGNGGGTTAVAWMGPDGDLWKGSADNTGSAYWHAGNDGAGSGLDADLLDGLGQTTANTGSTIVARDGSGNFAAGTITATLSGNASTASGFPTNYIGGQQTNPQTYFGQSVGLRVAMTGFPSVWADTLWINGYAGGDVLQMCALHTLRNGTPRMYISAQASNATSYGTTYEFFTTYNDGAGSGLDADLLDGLNSATANTASTIVARDASGNFNAGTINVAGGVANTDAGIRVHSPGGASFATQTATVNGAIKIRIPAAALGSNTMSSFRVSVYQYNTGLSQQFLISGYNYSVSSQWINVSAICLTDSGSEFTVRFGSDGTSQCVYIGELASSWSYPQVFVTDFCGGYTGTTQANWATGWNISFETTAFANVTATRTAVRSWNANNDGAGSGLDADLWDGYQLSTQGNWSTNSAINIVTGLLAWKNYGNAHTIFDASQSTSPAGGAVNNTNSQIAWASTYPTLMGWNGANTYGVRVDSCRLADTATTASNADLLDSINSTSFARVDSTSVFTVATYFQSNLGTTLGALSSPPLQAYATGTNAAFMSFHRAGTYAVNFGLDSDNVLRIGGWSASANRWQLDMSGNMTAAGTITASSDIKLKENIEVIDNALDKVSQIRGVTFTRNDQDNKEKRHAGVIAQEVEKVLPEVVMEGSDGIKSVAYGNLVGLLIEAIKEQQNDINNLRNELNALKNE